MMPKFRIGHRDNGYDVRTQDDHIIAVFDARRHASIAVDRLNAEWEKHKYDVLYQGELMATVIDYGKGLIGIVRDMDVEVREVPLFSTGDCPSFPEYMKRIEQLAATYDKETETISEEVLEALHNSALLEAIDELERLP